MNELEKKFRLDLDEKAQLFSTIRDSDHVRHGALWAFQWFSHIIAVNRNFHKTQIPTVNGIIDELASIAEAPLVVGSRYDIPPDSGDNAGFSDNYLIDLNGHRTDFGIGHYDHTYDRWIIHDDDQRTAFDPDHMTWQRLPLAKYDK